jgi:hypothetical protein
MNLEEIQTSWKIDSFIDKNNIALESIKTSSYHSKYLSELSNHKARIIKLESDYAIEKKSKIRYYNGELTKEELDILKIEQYQGRKMLKSDLEIFLLAEPDMQLIMQKIQYTTIIISFLEGVIKNLNNRNYEISNFISITKFNAGF